MEYDQPLIYDISNGVGKVVAPLIQMASDYVSSGNPFSSIMAAKGGASWASFVSSSLWSGVKSTVEEVQAGGHRRSQALLALGAGVLTSGPVGSNGAASSIRFINSSSKRVVSGGSGLLKGASKTLHYLENPEAIFKSPTLGIASKYLGNRISGTPGILNSPGSRFKIGWSSTGANGGGYQLRIGIGKNAANVNQAWRHIDLGFTFVPNQTANPYIVQIRGLRTK